MNDRKIIILLVFLVLAGFVFLSYKETAIENHQYQNQGWFLHFNDPKSNNLSFTIDNFSSKNDFYWSLSIEKDKILEETVTLDSGKKESISPMINLPEIDNKKITITVTNDDESKDINKFLTSE